MVFVIFHGSLGTVTSNWFQDLKKKLEYMGQTVYVPQFPIDNEADLIKNIPENTVQNLDSWMKTFQRDVLPHLKKGEKVCFIGHSLGNLFILHVINKFKIKLDSAIFVSPFLDKLAKVPKYYNKVNETFYKTDFNFDSLVKKIPVSYVLYSDTDPYVEPHRAKHFAQVLNSSMIMVKKADHFGASVNMAEFPLVFNLCVSRLDLNLYQEYSYKQQFEKSILNFISEEKRTIDLTPKQLDDLGLFFSENLKRTGFATFISNSKEWDPYSVYYRGSRELARRGVKISRVFIIKDLKDLKREILLEQIKADYEAGIDVRLVKYDDFKNIGCEEDFGIWDNEYLCVRNNTKSGKLLGGRLDSRVKSLLTAQNWRDRVIRISKPLVLKKGQKITPQLLKRMLEV